MHEVAHVERRDNLVVLLQAIAKAAFWPIPFLHLLNRELERAREEICDNHVLACRDAVSYGETLLRVAHLACETTMPVGTVGILHWRGKLEDRILGLLHNGRSKMTRMHPLIALAVLALFLSASAILCGTTIIAAQPPQTATPAVDRVTKSSDDDSRKAQDKRDQPPAAEAPVKAPQKQEKEKEAFTAWGQEVGGLQAGFGFRPGQKRDYRHGETVTLVVRVRNVGKKEVEFQYLKEFFKENPPIVTDADGKTLPGYKILYTPLEHVPKEESLAPGKEIELSSEQYQLMPANERGKGRTGRFPALWVGTGKVSVQYNSLFGNTSAGRIKVDPDLLDLATGTLELVVKDAAVAPPKMDQPKQGAKLQPGTEEKLNPKAEAVFRIPAEQVRAAKELAAAHRAQRGDRKSRRPAGLEDLDSPASIQRAIEQSIKGLAGKGPESVSLTELKYLGDAAFDALVQGANSEDSNVAKWCCVVLQHRGRKAVAPLCAVLASDAPSFVRSAAALSLGNTFESDGVPALIAALDDKDVRVSAISALMYPRDPRAIEPLRRLEKIPGIGHAATQSIEHIQSPQGYAWWPPESRKLRQVCEDARTLKGERYGQAEIDQLVTGLKSKQFDIADRCLYAFADLDAREAVPAMIALPFSQARIHALSQIGTTEAVDCIIDELHSINPQTRELTLDGMSSGADRWAAPLIIALLDDDSLKVKGKEIGFSIRAADPSDNWPESHKAHQALFMYLGRFGLQGEWRNLHQGETNDVSKEIRRLKEWWAQHGADFVAGKPVPNPKLTTVWYNDP